MRGHIPGFITLEESPFVKSDRKASDDEEYCEPQPAQTEGILSWEEAHKTKYFNPGLRNGVPSRTRGKWK